MWEILLSLAGAVLLFILFSEEFQKVIQSARSSSPEDSRLRRLAYPLAALILLAAVGIIAYALLRLLAQTFSYD